LAIFKIELVMADKRKKVIVRGKLHVISRVEAHPNVPLPPSTLSRIMLSKGKARDAEYKSGTQTKRRKNMKLGAYSELGKILLEWFQQMMLCFPIYFFLTCISLFLSELDLK
jgi:hypothetical protein